MRRVVRLIMNPGCQAEVRDGDTGEWRAFGALRPQAREDHSYTLVGSLLYVIGGYDIDYK